MNDYAEEAFEELMLWQEIDGRELRKVMNPHQDWEINYPEPGLVTHTHSDGTVVVRPMTEKEVAAWKATLRE